MSRLNFDPIVLTAYIVEGIILHYRSKRRGFSCYALGQMKEVARRLFNMELKIKITKHEVRFDTVIVTYK